MSELSFSTSIVPFGPAAAVLLTDAQVAALGSVKNPPVTLTIGGVTVRLRVARMGGENCIGLSKAARATLGVEVGAKVDVVVALDVAERTVELPPELAAALAADPRASAAFDGWPYTRRKEAARTIAEAKAEATRERRLAKILADLAG